MAAHYAVGLVGVVSVYSGLGQVFPCDLGLASSVLRYLRYLGGVALD